MMSDVIRQETLVFFLSVLHGVILTLGYDVLRALRRAFHHSTVAVSVEDFLFWLVAAFFTFCLTFFWTDGVIRGYVAVGIVIGAVLYHVSLSALVVGVLAGMLRGGARVISVGCRILSKPLTKICAFWKKLIEFVWKRVYNIFRGKKGNNSLKEDKKKKKSKKEVDERIRGKRYGRKKGTAKQKQP